MVVGENDGLKRLEKVKLPESEPRVELGDGGGGNGVGSEVETIETINNGVVKANQAREENLPEFDISTYYISGDLPSGEDAKTTDVAPTAQKEPQSLGEYIDFEDVEKDAEPIVETVLDLAGGKAPKVDKVDKPEPTAARKSNIDIKPPKDKARVTGGKAVAKGTLGVIAMSLNVAIIGMVALDAMTRENGMGLAGAVNAANSLTGISQKILKDNFGSLFNDKGEFDEKKASMSPYDMQVAKTVAQKAKQHGIGLENLLEMYNKFGKSQSQSAGATMGGI